MDKAHLAATNDIIMTTSSGPYQQEALTPPRPSHLHSSSSSMSSPSPSSSSSSSSPLKPNQVGQVILYGVPIVSLVIDNNERLCLAQISNTLLKNYSYNEIHNRRVALGITCVQCTPVQLELLRRAGAMPISSRRCGMITKREAERLCKSFLGAHSPPKLPENFAFDVSHDCAWGSRGSFIPARYNSSRAKCIKCSFCNMYFSPNKFIFHSHRTPESKYLQPDAANFNSWRRHLKLTEKKPSEDINHAWEDVKAMFNGGSRKRTLPMSSSGMSSMKAAASSSLTPSSPEIPHKALRCDEEQSGSNLNLATGARSFPVIPVPSKSFSMLQKIPPPLFPHHPYGFPGYGLCQKKSDALPDANKSSGVSGVFWPAKDALYPAFPVFWPAAGGLPMPPYPASPPKPPPELQDLSDQSDRGANTPKDSNPVQNLQNLQNLQNPQQDADRCCSSQSNSRNDEDKSGDETSQRKMSYISAFRPVVKDAESIAKLYGNRDGFGVRPGYLSPDFISESSSYRSASPDRDSAVEDDDDPDVDVESNPGQDEDEPVRISPGREQQDSPVPVPVPVPVQVQDRTEENREQPETCSPGTASASPEDGGTEEEDRQTRTGSGSSPHQVFLHEKLLINEPPPFGSKQSSRSNGLHPGSDIQTQRSAASYQDRPADGSLRIDISVHERDLENMAKEELQKQLVEQVELRKKLEREFQHLKDNFQDQMKRELSYREEMVQQLQIVRDTLCSELDQERKARYAIQQKLKEAHDALHHFSCKMLTPRQCSGACTFKPPLLPP